LDDFTIHALVNALLRNLNELILSLSSLKVNKFYQHEVNSSNHNNMKNMESTEINAVILLEWLCNLSFINKTKSDLIWPRIHEFLRSIFEDNIDNLQSISPYFVERCIVKILQAGSQIAVKDYSKSTIIEKGHGRNHPFLLETALTPSTQDKMSSTALGNHILVEFMNCDPHVMNDVAAIERDMVGAVGAPSNNTAVAPDANTDTSQFHIIQPVVVKYITRSPGLTSQCN
jgi:hypothetical protein